MNNKTKGEGRQFKLPPSFELLNLSLPPLLEGGGSFSGINNKLWWPEMQNNLPSTTRRSAVEWGTVFPYDAAKESKRGLFTCLHPGGGGGGGGGGIGREEAGDWIGTKTGRRREERGEFPGIANLPNLPDGTIGDFFEQLCVPISTFGC